MINRILEISKIQSGKLVELDYQILDDEGRLYESSEDEGPLMYVQGHGELPDSLEAALDGAAASLRARSRPVPK